MLRLTLGPGEGGEGWCTGDHLQSTHGLQDTALQATQHQHHDDADELGSQSVARQSSLSGFVKHEVAVERHKGGHTYDAVHVQIGVDGVPLENNKRVL